ncbi:uncharacterized protein LOC131669878 [Phymastichus coffea]|uniref:uncharacterized protein LOC131669878 n=1 Tax=Phymastichus coffea TaxID=108790 RepID=UPI00273C7236|nr:uncharacterized protein LOC131669878 [Phymastichus coffea]
MVFNGVLIGCLIQNAVILQYSTALIVIDHLFKVLNENLSKMFSLSAINISVIFESKVKKSTLSRLKASYVLLSNLCHELSDFFSFPMIFCLLSVFGSLLATTYNLTVPLFMNILHVNHWTFYLSIFYFLQCVFPLLVLMAYIFMLTKESKRTSKIIDRHLAVIRNPVIKRMLNQFSVCILHTDVKFTIFDWFSLNGSLLISIAGSITTYLVVAVRYQAQPTPSCIQTSKLEAK